jgi:hypothetical protein
MTESDKKVAQLRIKFEDAVRQKQEVTFFDSVTNCSVTKSSVTFFGLQRTFS